MLRIAYPQPVIQEIANYLVNRPYGEVAGMMQGLQTQGFQMDDTGVMVQPDNPAPAPAPDPAHEPVADSQQAGQPAPAEPLPAHAPVAPQ